MRHLLALIATLAATFALADSNSLSTEEALGKWVTYFYSHPEPHRVPEALAAASKLDAFRGGKAVPPFFGFVAGVLGKEPALAAVLIEQFGDLPESAQPVVILGIWYSGHPDTRALLASIARAKPVHASMLEALKGTAPRLVDISLEEGPWVLDALWGHFMATGDDGPVLRIMSALPWVEVRGNIPKLLVGGAAQWSLASNAVQHPRVLQLCKAQLSAQPKDVALVLRKVISMAEEDLSKRDASESKPSSETTK